MYFNSCWHRWKRAKVLAMPPCYQASANNPRELTPRESMSAMTMTHFLCPSGSSIIIHSLSPLFKMSGEGGQLSALRERTWLMGFIHSDTTVQKHDLHDNYVFLHTCLYARYQWRWHRKSRERRQSGKKTWKTRGFGNILKKELWGFCKLFHEVLTSL